MAICTCRPNSVCGLSTPRRTGFGYVSVALSRQLGPILCSALECGSCVGAHCVESPDGNHTITSQPSVAILTEAILLKPVHFEHVWLKPFRLKFQSRGIMTHVPYYPRFSMGTALRRLFPAEGRWFGSDLDPEFVRHNQRSWKTFSRPIIITFNCSSSLG